MLFPRIHSQPQEILTFKGLIRLGDPIISGEKRRRETKQSNTVFRRKTVLLASFTPQMRHPKINLQRKSCFCMRSRKCAGESNQISSMSSVFENIHTHRGRESISPQVIFSTAPSIGRLGCPGVCDKVTFSIPCVAFLFLLP